MKPETKTVVDENMKKEIIKVVKGYLKSAAFTDRKLTDNPTDALQVVNRRYTNLNGTLANRPASVAAVVGQHYFATDTNIPMTFDGTAWRNGSGSIVASN